MDRLTLPAEDARETQAGAARDQLGQLDGRLARLGASAMHANIDLDHHPQSPTARGGRRSQLAHVARIVHRDDAMRAMLRSMTSRSSMSAGVSSSSFSLPITGAPLGRCARTLQLLG